MVSAGVATVADVLESADALEVIPGVGEVSARRAVSAARTIWRTTFDEMPIRIDIEQRRPEEARLLAAIASWDGLRRSFPSPEDLRIVDSFASLKAQLGTCRGVLVNPRAPSEVDAFRRDVDLVSARAASLRQAASLSARRGGDPWDDFLARPADYFSLLAELGLVVEDEGKVHGDLPVEIVEAIRDQELKTEHLRASLRGYQAFAARFALVQGKVIIGDEMGLGKTIEALAVFAHLRARGHHHFLVVCPASVVTNWVREIASKSSLHPHRLHGPGRDWAAKSWARGGGVAVTTFDSLGWLDYLTDQPEIAGLVVDEAHYIKNPDALRTQRTLSLIDVCAKVMLLTGTPLENRVEEFRNLASYLRPDLVVAATDFAPKRFRRQIAPAYLRRNQEDVLAELPELVQVEEWLPLSGSDRAWYREAVEAGNFMGMRQAAFRSGRDSEKVSRLREIIEEASASGRRVIVFSYFREVLSVLSDLIGGAVFGPITGSVPAAARQGIVDAFSAAAGGAVLLAQIVAGGQGLNIQSASVVVICEPQIKPTLEAQAIARAHRMGQVRSVQVHRLLSEEGVDARLCEILQEKRRLFDEFARDSEIAAAAPEALDLTEAELARQVVAEERERLARSGVNGEHDSLA